MENLLLDQEGLTKQPEKWHLSSYVFLTTHTSLSLKQMQLPALLP